jgi:hypothetical protein
MGRYKPIPGGLVAAVRAADTHENNTAEAPYPLVLRAEFGWYPAKQLSHKRFANARRPPRINKDISNQQLLQKQITRY